MQIWLLSILTYYLIFPGITINCLGIFSHTDCGNTKSCFRTSNCDFNQCTFAVSWRTVKFDVSEYLEVELSGKLVNGVNEYVSLGFSDDKKMSNDGVIGCYLFNGSLGISAAYNPAFYNTFYNESLTGEDFLKMSDQKLYGIEYNSSSQQLRCRIARKMKPSKYANEMKDLSGDNKYYLMWSIGKMRALNRFSKHYTNTKDCYKSNMISFSSNVRVNIIDEPSYTFKKVHGCLMLIGWILFITNGIVLARYYKNNWPTKTFLKQKIWFQSHRIIQMIGLVLVLIGFILIFVYENGYSYLGDSIVDNAHPILGIIATALLVVNPIMSLFRCNPTDSRRPIFNWCHSIVGFTAYFLALITITIGLQLPQAGKFLSTLVFPWLLGVVFIGLIVILFIISSIMGRAKVVAGNDIQMKSTNEEEVQVQNNKSQAMSCYVLGASVSISFIFTLVLVVIVWIY